MKTPRKRSTGTGAHSWDASVPALFHKPVIHPSARQLALGLWGWATGTPSRAVAGGRQAAVHVRVVPRLQHVWGRGGGHNSCGPRGPSASCSPIHGVRVIPRVQHVSRQHGGARGSAHQWGPPTRHTTITTTPSPAPPLAPVGPRGWASYWSHVPGGWGLSGGRRVIHPWGLPTPVHPAAAALPQQARAPRGSR